jgi:hypothetical protein
MYHRNVGNTAHLRMVCPPRVELKSVNCRETVALSHTFFCPPVPLLGPVTSADSLVIPRVRLWPLSLNVEMVLCHKVLRYFRFVFLLLMGSQPFGALNLTV